MTRIVVMAVQFVSTGVGFYEYTVRQAGFPEHSAVGSTLLVGPDMTAGYSGGYSVGIDPPSCLSFNPVIGLELDSSFGTGDPLCDIRRVAPTVGGRESDR
jgi:hypothetical protein